MSVVLSLGVVAVTLLVVVFLQWKRKYSKLPPGPRPLPIIGNFNQIGDGSMPTDITKLGKTYSDIFTVHLLMTPMIIMNSYKVIKDLLMSPEYADVFSGRDSKHFHDDMFPNGLVYNNGHQSQQYMRRIVMRGVKTYGPSLKRVESIAKEELGNLVNRIREKNGIAFNYVADVSLFTNNILLVLLCGERFEEECQIMETNRAIGNEFSYLLNYKHQVFMDTVPFALWLHPGLREKVHQVIEHGHYLSNTIAEKRKQNRSCQRDCLYALLEEEEKKGTITKANIRGILLDMLVTGLGTTSPTIQMTFLAMAKFPEFQKKAYEEILSVVGGDRLPGLDDKPKLSYSHAFMLETFRYFTLAPLPGPRMAITDCTYRGYFIPKGTMTTYNVWNVHHDEEFWENPFEFDPTRFLDSSGSILPSDHERRMRLLTFGLGKRSCVGENLARVRVFLALTAIVQNFELKEDPSMPLPSCDPRTFNNLFLTVAPSYKLRFISRKNTS